MWIYIFKIVEGKITYLTSLPKDLPKSMFSSRVQELRKTHRIPPDQPDHCICWSDTTKHLEYYY